MSQDALSSAINPAVTPTLGREFEMSVEIFAPFRGYEATGTFFMAPGILQSGRNISFVPNIAFKRPIDDSSALTFSLYGNGLCAKAMMSMLGINKLKKVTNA